MNTIIINQKRYYYSLNNPIGEGSFGVVYLGQEELTQKTVAIKIIGNIKKNLLNDYLNEINIMKKITENTSKTEKEFFVQLLDYDIDYDLRKIYMILEYCNLKDLKTYIIKHHNTHLNEKKALNLISHIVYALKILRNINIMHRDLKPSNVLLNLNKITGKIHIKLTDFGCSKSLTEKLESNTDNIITKKYEHNMLLRTSTGTPLYMSPQLLKKENYSSKSDIWSLGILYYQMLFGSMPWPVDNFNEYLEILKNKTPITFPENMNKISSNSQDFIKRCLEYEEKDRLDWEDLFKHTLFQNKFVILEPLPQKSTKKILLLEENTDPYNNPIYIKRLHRKSNSLNPEMLEHDSNANININTNANNNNINQRHIKRNPRIRLSKPENIIQRNLDDHKDNMIKFRHTNQSISKNSIDGGSSGIGYNSINNSIDYDTNISINHNSNSSRIYGLNKSNVIDLSSSISSRRNSTTYNFLRPSVTSITSNCSYSATKFSYNNNKNFSYDNQMSSRRLDSSIHDENQIQNGGILDTPNASKSKIILIEEETQYSNINSLYDCNSNLRDSNNSRSNSNSNSKCSQCNISSIHANNIHNDNNITIITNNNSTNEIKYTYKLNPLLNVTCMNKYKKKKQPNIHVVFHKTHDKDSLNHSDFLAGYCCCSIF